MDGGLLHDQLAVTTTDLGRLMPMSAWVTPAGRIRAAGPTLARIGTADGSSLAGADFFAIFEVIRPLPAATAGDLRSLAGRRLQLRLRHGPRTALRGHLVALPEDLGLLVNLSFGIGVADAVRDHRLTNADFAPTDLAIELLYLTEAKAAVMAELAALNARLRTAHEQAEAAAMTDSLTGLSNRRGFETAFARTLSAAERGTDFALLHLDLDHFKEINDTLGHAAGDEALIHVADVLRAELRGQDVSARIGGDEFVVLVQDLCDETATQRLAARLIAGIERFEPSSGHRARLSASIGAVLSRRYTAPQADRLLAAADVALYEAKRSGRGRCVVAPA